MIENNHSDPVFIDEFSAASRLSLSVSTLRQYRLKGGGPKYCKLTARAVRYPVDELDRWARSRMIANTSQKVA